MAERYTRIEEALHEIGERRVPDAAVDLWPAVRGRVGERSPTGPRRPGRAESVPSTRAGLALVAALAVALFGVGAYAASGLLYDTFREFLPGAEGPVYGEKLNLAQTVGGATVTLEWAYADARSVVVGYDVGEGRGDEIHKRVRLTDESGERFDSVDGGYYGSGPTVDVFEPEGKIEPGAGHRFRLEIPATGRPFVFDFEIPVRPAPVVEVGQTDAASGVALTLDRVVASPARPEATICYGSPDTAYGWDLAGPRGSFFGSGPQIGQARACTPVLLPYRLEGRSTVTVERLEGWPGCPPGDDDGCTIPRSKAKTIRGPWVFEFGVPEP